MSGRVKGPPPGSLARRLGVYQSERFPLTGYTPLVVAFTLSAAAYSRAARGAAGFVPWELLAAGCATSLVFFFMLRVLDEHKDAATDRRYRPELPVPRGLVTLGELRRVGVGALLLVLGLNAVLAPVLLWPCLAVAAWAALMTREFFCPEWLRARPTAYLVSHMAIMPLIDLYTTGLDWLAAGAVPSAGLNYFLVVTFLNGSLIEIGRKIRAPGTEREGVDTYSKAWGPRAAVAAWLGVLLAAAASAWLAAGYTGAAGLTAAVLAGLTPLAALPATRFLRRPGPVPAGGIEKASGLWTLASYLLLGIGPLAAGWPG